VAEGVAIAIIFLSFTLLTGEGGMISLCQITFAGIGGLATAQVNATYHLPVLLGVVVGGLLAGAGGLIVGTLTARMGNLYAALATLTFGLLFSAIVFQFNVFLQYGSGVTVSRPSFASSNVTLTYVTLALFVLVSLFIAAIRRSTSGLALSAIRNERDRGPVGGNQRGPDEDRDLDAGRGDRGHRRRHVRDLHRSCPPPVI